MFKTNLTSYDLKYSVDQALEDAISFDHMGLPVLVSYAAEKIGVSLQDVLQYQLLAGEFAEDSEIADPLKKIGVNKILITGDGLKFTFNEESKNGFHATNGDCADTKETV